MIEINVKRNGKDQVYDFKVEGHAYAAEAGQDIICAGVSMLTQTVILGLCDIVNVGIDYKISDGFLHLRIPQRLTKVQRLKTDVLLETMILGLKNIKESYPEYIILHDGEV